MSRTNRMNVIVVGLMGALVSLAGCGDPDQCYIHEDCGPCRLCELGDCVQAPEVCGDGLDNDCNGEADEGCPCTGVVCDDPPPRECADAETLRVYRGPGTCEESDGTCRYEHDDHTCPRGCVDDECLGDVCIGLDCDDGNPCTDDACDPVSGCTYANNTGPCDDGDACTSSDTCAGGACHPGAALDCDDGELCTDDGCDPASGCAHIPNTAPCEDGDACSIDDACRDGACQAGSPRDCDDGDVCTTDSCDASLGCLHANNTLACEDGDLCTHDDRCSQGACVPGEAADCDDDNPCTEDACAPLLGCLHEANTAPCDDGDPCTMDDGCSQGVCYGPPLDADGDSHVSSACGGNDCEDGNPGIHPGIYEGPMTGAACSDGLDNDCDGLTDQQDPTCGDCENDADCLDTNLCNGEERCVDQVCQGGQALDCDDGNACTDDSCNPASGCANTNNSAPCDDQDACTVGDACLAGACTPGADRDCNDANVCTDDSCDTAAGCVNTDNTAACDDGDACTVTDVCAGGTCQGSGSLDCDDDNVCTDDGCNPASGCENVNNTAPCDDGDACTVTDICAGGICQGSGAPDCDDDNLCTDDSCDPASGCVHTNNTAACDDGDACTVTDICAGGTCQGSGAPDCDDANVCTDDACDPASGCVNTNNTAACDDGDACTEGDLCSAGSCQPGSAADCDDGNVCTDDSCEPSSGDCLHANNTVACDDQDPCTDGDVCADGLCAGVAVVACTEGDGCCPAGCSHAEDADCPTWSTPVDIGRGYHDHGAPDIAMNDQPTVFVTATADAVAGTTQHQHVIAVRFTEPLGWEAPETFNKDGEGPGANPSVGIDQAGRAVLARFETHTATGGGRYHSIFSNNYTPQGGWDADRSQGGVAQRGTNMRPQVAMNATGRASLVWIDYKPTGYDGEVVTSSWYERFDGWRPAAVIEEEALAYWSHLPQVGIDAAGDAIAIWLKQDGYQLPDSVWVDHFTPTGGWGQELGIESSSVDAREPQLLVRPDGSGIAAWLQGGVWVSHFAPGGTWSAPVRIDSASTIPVDLRIAAGGDGSALAVWSQEEGIRPHVWACRLDPDTGWEAAVLVEDNAAGAAERPDVALDAAGNATVVWDQTDGTRRNIWATRYLAGHGWLDPDLIESADGDATSPRVASNGPGDVFAVWLQEETAGSDTYYYLKASRFQ